MHADGKSTLVSVSKWNRERSIKSGQKDTEASTQAFSVTDSTDRSDSKVAFFIDFGYPNFVHAKVGCMC